MPTDVIVGGSILMKEVLLKDSTWTVKIRGNFVDLAGMAIDDHFEGTQSNFWQMLHLVKKLKIRCGVTAKLSIQEQVSNVSNDNTADERSRSKRCLQCVQWLAVSDACRNCLSSGKSKRQYIPKSAASKCPTSNPKCHSADSHETINEY